ncbi:MULTISPECIES: M4 family metallopeptidase [unclassified Corallococcus]|uniref:M4 family metallopeptidase n=1 Tax=unclassified Corallococcus TaxID=2685029 RepID=UPI001A8F4AB7|nr:MULTISPECIES: M4 family metallopeptidase [unclassified Corallococcus]MBN9683684.1 M4 family metallopeptidase [Corallococcus sp. NCSPR001]WAS84808.1 M4 family metallopeptidase [Corallococcus sp. NCRR]
MTRRHRWLLAGLTFTLSACGAGGPDAEAPPAPSEARLGDLKSALGALPGAEVRGVHADGVPQFIQGELGTAGRPLSGASAWQAHALLEPTLLRVLPAFRLTAKDLVPKRIHTDELGNTHLRYTQTKGGLPVVNEELIVHLDAKGQVYAVNGTARDGEPLPAAARIAPEAASAAALAASPPGSRAEAPREVFVRPDPDAALVRAFEVVVSGQDADGMPLRDRVYVSAADGQEVLRAPEFHAARNRKVCSVGGPNSGTCRIEGQGATGDTAIDKTYDNLGLFYDCFQANFGRDSWNGMGAQLLAQVHYGTSYANAYFDGAKLVCGDGSLPQLGQPCEDPDIVVHEFMHGVTETTSDLIYSGESGALSESLSDIYAATCGSWASGTWSTATSVWHIAETAWTPGTSGDALRYMNDPAADGASVDYAPDLNSGTDVHYGSGVANLAFKLMATGGVHPRGKTLVNVPAIGVQAAAHIFWYANMNLFTRNTNLYAARTATRVAAQSLGYSTAVQDAVDAAWSAVGVGVTTTPSCTPLPNNTTVSLLSGSASSQKYYCFDVPANTPSTVSISSGTGDVDLYTRFAMAPTTQIYDCRPYLSGNNETCNLVARPTAGRQYILLRGYSAYSGVSLSVAW